MSTSTKIRRFLRANALGLIAIYLALAGVAVAAKVAPKNSVKSSSIKDGQVNTADLAQRAVNGGKVADDALTGDQVDEATLDPSILQARVDDACASGQAIRAILEDGGIACENVGGGGVPDGSITTPKLADGAVTTTKLADALITIPKLSFDVATQTELDALATPGTINQGANPVNWTKLRNVPAGFADGTDDVGSGGPPTGAAGGSLAGTYPNPTIADDAISGSNVVDSGLTGADVADVSLSGQDIQDDTVTGGDVEDSGLTGRDIEEGSIRSGDISDATLTGGDVEDSSLGGADVANGTLTGTDVQNNSIGFNDLFFADGLEQYFQKPLIGGCPGQSVVRGFSQDGQTVDCIFPSANGAAGGDLAGFFPNPTIAADAVGGAKVADGSLTGSDVQNGTITGGDIQNGTISEDDILGDSISSALILDGNITSADIGDGNIGSIDIADGSINPLVDIGTVPAVRAEAPRQNVACDSALQIPANTLTPVTFEREAFDTANMHLTGSQSVNGCNDPATARLSAPVTGVYQISGGVSWDDGASVGDRTLVLQKNADDHIARSNFDGGQNFGDTGQVVATTFRLLAGDSVRLLVSHNACDANSPGCPPFNPVLNGGGDKNSFLSMSLVTPG